MKTPPYRHLAIVVAKALVAKTLAATTILGISTSIALANTDQNSTTAAPQKNEAPVVTEASKLIGTAQEAQPSTPAEATPLPTTEPASVAQTPVEQNVVSQQNSTQFQAAQRAFSISEIKEAEQKLAAREITLLFPHSIESIYASFPFFAWQDNAQRKLFLEQLSVMALSGINAQFTTWLTAFEKDDLSPAEQDLILTDALLGYLNFVNLVPENGTKWLYSANSYKVQDAPIELRNSWINALNSGNTTQFLSELAPQHKFYAPMLAEMKNLMNESSIDWPVITIDKSLKPGASTNQAKSIETVLSYYGYLDLPTFEQNEANAETKQESNTNNSNTDETSATSYNARLVNGIKYFQQSLGLTPDGVIGQRTKEWLNISPEQRINLIALNIQRLRLIPSEVKTGIMVNIPDYSLRFYREGDVILDSRVIVGSPARKTPLMSNSINRVVINPPWSVPVKLAREDLAPKGVNDPNYFIQHGYTLIEPGTNQPISVDEVNWDYVTPDNFPFAVRQSPGAGNSLGRYKFDMPNDQAIYLHDTPNHRLFEKDIRAISSGCIRVNKSTELANLLLEPKNWDSKKIAGTVKNGQTTPVNLDNRVPVQLYYLTAWVDDSGKAQFRTDIYQYDKSALKNSANARAKIALM